jgi:leucine-rich repeat protein SHOC2
VAPGHVRFLLRLRRPGPVVSLDLSDNHFTSLPPSIARLTNLQHLYLSGNRIASLPQDVIRLPNLLVIFMEDTPMQELPPDVPSSLTIHLK